MTAREQLTMVRLRLNELWTLRKHTRPLTPLEQHELEQLYNAEGPLILQALDEHEPPRTRHLTYTRKA